MLEHPQQVLILHDPVAAGVVLALRHYPQQLVGTPAETARRSEAVAWTLAWCRASAFPVVPTRVRTLVGLFSRLEGWPSDSTS